MDTGGAACSNCKNVRSCLHLRFIHSPLYLEHLHEMQQPPLVGQASSWLPLTWVQAGHSELHLMLMKPPHCRRIIGDRRLR